ncbi:50S ribosomal protein L21 [bacterium Unc6]|nr:50S ribosomal protein L21 [bacterium Unc6]
MYAVVEVGDKQYCVEQGSQIKTELITPEQNGKFTVKNVLMIKDGEKIKIGRPFVEGSSVECSVLKEVKGPKVIAFQYRRRKESKRTKGHRQRYTLLKVEKIVV